LIALARVVANGALHLEPGSRVEETLQELRKIPGIGDWTVEYIAMRALAWPDAFPHTDMGIKKVFKTKNPKQILALAEKWRPWRAYAALHLWADLSEKGNQMRRVSLAISKPKSRANVCDTRSLPLSPLNGERDRVRGLKMS
jgi:AraC family transcriptional regulator of adaptative response / DNA-3-methyladenine glycosylase II